MQHTSRNGILPTRKFFFTENMLNYLKTSFFKKEEKETQMIFCPEMVMWELVPHCSHYCILSYFKKSKQNKNTLEAVLCENSRH